MMSTTTTGNSQYTKARTEKATIGESSAIAMATVAPAIRIARMAFFTAFVALVVAIVALVAVIWK